MVFLDLLDHNRRCCWWNVLSKLLREFVQIAATNKYQNWSWTSKWCKNYSPLTWVQFVSLCFSTLLDLFWEREVCAWCQCPRACPLTHCAKRVNATNSHRRRLWTVKPSMAGTGSSVPVPCHPLGRNREMLHGNRLTHICFIFPPLHHSSNHLLLNFFHTLDFI